MISEGKDRLPIKDFLYPLYGRSDRNDRADNRLDREVKDLANLFTDYVEALTDDRGVPLSGKEKSLHRSVVVECLVDEIRRYFPCFYAGNIIEVESSPFVMEPETDRLISWTDRVRIVGAVEGFNVNYMPLEVALMKIAEEHRIVDMLDIPSELQLYLSLTDVTLVDTYSDNERQKWGRGSLLFPVSSISPLKLRAAKG